MILTNLLQAQPADSLNVQKNGENEEEALIALEEIAKGIKEGLKDEEK